MLIHRWMANKFPDVVAEYYVFGHDDESDIDDFLGGKRVRS